MNSPKDKANEILATSIIKNLKNRNIKGFYFENSKMAVDYIMENIPKDSIISFGGSVTLLQSQMLKTLRASNKINLIDRDTAKTNEQRQKMYHDSFSCDYYFMSSNAITIEGELINIDAVGNRVSALIFGPKNVIILAGMNKIVKDRNEAINRVQNMATPANAIRLGMDTPCKKLGYCVDCHNDFTMCCQIVITRHSFIKNRIKVFLINENLGF